MIVSLVHVPSTNIDEAAFMTSNCSHPPGGDQDTLNVTDAAEFNNSILNTINLGKRTGCTGKDQSEIYGKHKYVNVVKHKHYTHTH